MMAQQIPTLRRPLAQIVGAVIMIVVIFAGTFWLADMASLTYQGHIEGRWYVDAADFRASIYLQIVLSLIAIGAGLAWLFTTILRRRDFNANTTRTLAIVLGTAIAVFLALYVTHHWFEVIICQRGSIPSECTLYFKP